MEKKNTILLTVIAIATLLVAVVGATFAYFTATVKVTNEDNATTTVKTYALASATMDMGDTVQSTSNVYPGFKAVKPVTVTGACPEGVTTCDDVNAVISVTPTIDEAFGTGASSAVTWKLYQSDTEITCTSVPTTNAGQYYDAGTCTIPEGASPVLSGSTEAKSLDVAVKGGITTNYYLVVEYANNESAAQNTQQGKTFSVALDFTAKQTTASDVTE